MQKACSTRVVVIPLCRFVSRMGFVYRSLHALVVRRTRRVDRKRRARPPNPHRASPQRFQIMQEDDMGTKMKNKASRDDGCMHSCMHLEPVALNTILRRSPPGPSIRRRRCGPGEGGTGTGRSIGLWLDTQGSIWKKSSRTSKEANMRVYPTNQSTGSIHCCALKPCSVKHKTSSLNQVTVLQLALSPFLSFVARLPAIVVPRAILSCCHAQASHGGRSIGRLMDEHGKNPSLLSWLVVERLLVSACTKLAEIGCVCVR